MSQTDCVEASRMYAETLPKLLEMEAAKEQWIDQFNVQFKPVHKALAKQKQNLIVLPKLTLSQHIQKLTRSAVTLPKKIGNVTGFFNAKIIELQRTRYDIRKKLTIK